MKELLKQILVNSGVKVYDDMSGPVDSVNGKAVSVSSFKLYAASYLKNFIEDNHITEAALYQVETVKSLDAETLIVTEYWVVRGWFK